MWISSTRINRIWHIWSIIGVSVGICWLQRIKTSSLRDWNSIPNHRALSFFSSCCSFIRLFSASVSSLWTMSVRQNVIPKRPISPKLYALTNFHIEIAVFMNFILFRWDKMFKTGNNDMIGFVWFVSRQQSIYLILLPAMPEPFGMSQKTSGRTFALDPWGTTPEDEMSELPLVMWVPKIGVPKHSIGIHWYW